MASVKTKDWWCVRLFSYHHMQQYFDIFYILFSIDLRRIASSANIIINLVKQERFAFNFSFLDCKK